MRMKSDFDEDYSACPYCDTILERPDDRESGFVGCDCATIYHYTPYPDFPGLSIITELPYSPAGPT